MNISKFFKLLTTPYVRTYGDGSHGFVEINSIEDIKILKNQIELIPEYPNLDKEWILNSLNTLIDHGNRKEIQQFIETNNKIEAGTDLNYKGQPEKFVEQLKIIYPDVKWKDLTAVGKISN